MLNSSAADNESPRAVPWWQTGLALIWLAAFAGCFYQFDLPNSEPKVNRTLIWKQVPVLLVNSIDPPEPAVENREARQLWKHAGWRFLPQRFGMYGVALSILAGAWAWGNLFLRILRVPLACWSVERTFFSMVCGLSIVSLQTLACGLAGFLSQPILGSILGVGLFCELVARVFTFSSQDLAGISGCLSCLRPRQMWPLLVMLPFLMCYVGGGFLPEIDFDVKEYHFGGPKEWYQAGQIRFLPHNVYTSFPFLTEMLTLLGMVIYGDWYWGALAGKGVLMCFGPLTALGIYAAGRRWFSHEAGVWGAFIHLSTPWIYRISIIAYAEGGLACYLFATLLAVMFRLDRQQTIVRNEDWEPQDLSGSWTVLAGFLAGSAMACKYPGVISVVIPLGIVLLVKAVRNRADQPAPGTSLRTGIWCGWIFGCGVLCAIGPWLLKNLIETGNPVYPLLYNVFGGTDWNAELNAKWKRGHSPDGYELFDLAVKLMDVSLKSDWLSPLLFGLAPLSLMTGFRRRAAWLWMYVVYLFGTWWLLTHRIDRFWVPLIPVVSLLAGIGATWNAERWWRWVIRIAVALAATFNLAFMTTSLCGYNAYLLDLQIAAEQTARITAPEVLMLNSQLPAGARVLCVGEAELFDARFSYVYNTVFDKSIFEEWFGEPDFAGDAASKPNRSPEGIRRVLQQHGITHILVNWQEILRYRQTYGYTNFVTPRRFLELQAAGLLGSSTTNAGGQPWSEMQESAQQEVLRWGPELVQEWNDSKYFKTVDVFPVQQ